MQPICAVLSNSSCTLAFPSPQHAWQGRSRTQLYQLRLTPIPLSVNRRCVWLVARAPYRNVPGRRVSRRPAVKFEFSNSAAGLRWAQGKRRLRPRTAVVCVARHPPQALQGAMP